MCKSTDCSAGSSQDKIDFDCPPVHNEGNFIAILRLLAGSNSCLEEHLN